MELVTQGLYGAVRSGHTVPLVIFYQMKMWKTASMSFASIIDWIVSVRSRATKLGLQDGDYYLILYVSNAFASEKHKATSRQLDFKAECAKGGVIIVEPESIRSMLRPCLEGSMIDAVIEGKAME